jgi:hypothetical protein
MKVKPVADWLKRQLAAVVFVGVFAACGVSSAFYLDDRYTKTDEMRETKSEIATLIQELKQEIRDGFLAQNKRIDTLITGSRCYAPSH